MLPPTRLTGLHHITLVTRDMDDNRLSAGGMHHIALGVEEEDDLRAQTAVLDEKGIGHSGIVDRGKWNPGNGNYARSSY